MLNVKKVLFKETPLMFQWLSKNVGNSVPNNEDFPYLQRLVNWAEREPKRNIYLVVTGLQPGQIKDLKEKLSPMPNIKVVDFNEVDLGKNDFVLPTPGGEFKISELLKYRHDEGSVKPSIDVAQPQRLEFFAKNIPFGIILDSMRLAILQNIEKITGRAEAIYMDFDILPSEKEQLGEIRIPMGILMDKANNDSFKTSYVENSIIAVNDQNDYTLSDTVFRLETTLKWKCETCQFNEKEFIKQLNTGLVYDCMKDSIQSQVFLKNLINLKDEVSESVNNEKSDEVQSLIQTLSELIKEVNEYKLPIEKMFLDSEILEDIREKYSVQIEKMHEPYQFQENGGKVKSMNDSSWTGKKELYGKPELPLVFSKHTAKDVPSSKFSESIASKETEKPDTKLNSFTSLAEMAARKIIDNPSRN